MVSRRFVVAALAALAVGCRDVPARDRPDPVPDAAVGDAGPDVAVDYGEDGMPTRQACVTPDGTAMADGAFGRLDGLVVAVSTPGRATNRCSRDSDHLHLQVLALGAIYDISINVGRDVHSETFERPLFGPAWREGWHTGPDIFVDYAGLDLHAATIPLPPPGALVEAMAADLALANHVSIYATGYGPDGAHLVHRNGGGRDGLLVTHPLRGAAHARAFSFDEQDY